MHRHHDLRLQQPDQLDPLLRIHRDHEQGYVGGGDSGAAEMDEHEIDGCVGGGEMEGDLMEVGDEEGVAGDVDAETCVGGGVR